MGILKNLREFKSEIDKDTGLEEGLTKAKEAETSLDVDPVEGQSFMGLTRRTSADQKLFEDASDGAAKLYQTPDFVRTPINIENDDLTDLAAYGQSTATEWGNAVGKLTGKTATAVAGGIGTIFTSLYGLGKYAMTDADAADSFKSVFDNEFTRGLDDINEALDYNLPNYIAKEERDLGFFKSLGTGNFWANDFTNGLSFIAGAIITEAALSAATAATFGGAAPAQAIATAGLLARAKKMFRLAGKTAKMTDKMGDAARLTRGGLSAMQKARGASKVMRQLVTGAGYEAGVEARHHLDSVEKDLVEDFVSENGRQPTDQELAFIKDLATQSANSVFTTNVALVGGGNMLQFPKIFGPGARSMSGSFGKIVRDAGEEAITAPYRAAYRSMGKGKYVSAAYHALKNPFYEGFVEEGGQSWLSNAGRHASAEYYSKKDRPHGVNAALDLIRSLDDTFIETYGAKDTQKEIGLGFLLGAMGIPTYAKSQTTGKRQFEIQGGIVGAIREQKDKRRRTDKLVDYLNKNPNAAATIKNMKSNFENFSRATSLQQEMDAALAEQNMFAYKNAENDQMYSYVDSRIQAGLFEHVLEDFESVRESSNEQFAKDMGYDTSTMTEQELTDRKNKVVDSAIEKAKKIKKAHDQINNNPKFAQYSKEVRDMLTHAVAVADNVDLREADLQKRVNELAGTTIDFNTAYSEKAPTVDRELQQIEDVLRKDDTLEDSSPDKLSPEARAELEVARDALQQSALNGFGQNTREDANIMNQFIKNNPNEAAKTESQEEMLSTLRDLRMLRARREQFIDLYNNLTDPEGQREAFQQIEYYMDDYNKEEAERQRVESEQAIRENDKVKFYNLNRDGEVEITENGKKKYYKFLDPTTLYNVKNANDKISMDDIMSNGVLKPNVFVLDQNAIERRKVAEAIERIQKTDTSRLVEIQKEIEELDKRLNYGAEAMRVQLKRYETRRDEKGRFVSITQLENDMMLSESLYQELSEKRDQLQGDVEVIRENAKFLDQMLKETESAFMLPMEDRLALEKQLKEQGLEQLGISGTTLQPDGKVKLSTRTELETNAQGSISRTEQALEELMDQIAVLEDSAQKTKNYYDVLKDILMEDRFFNAYTKFKETYPGANPLDAAKFIEFANEQADLANQYPEFADLLVNRPKMYSEFQDLYKKREDQKFLEDEFFATEEKLEKLETTLRAAKQREAAMIDALDNKYKGMEKVQRSIIFGTNYTALQKRLAAINVEEGRIYDQVRGINVATPAPKSSEAVTIDGPSRTADFISNEDKTHTKPDAFAVGYGKTGGIDVENKFEDTSEENMSSDQRRFFKFIDNILPNDIRNDRYELRAFHRGNIESAGLEQKDIDALNQDEFFTGSEATPESADIVLAVYDKVNKKYARSEDGGLIYTKQLLPNEDGSKFSGVNEDNKAQFDILTEAYKTSRRKILLSRGPVSFRITGKGRGTAVMQKDADGNYVKGAALGRITNDEKKLKKVKISVATGVTGPDGFTTIQEGGNKYKVVRGMPYAVHKGYPVPLETRTLTDTEIETVVQILAAYGTKLHSTDKDVAATANIIEGTDVQVRPYLNSLIGFNRRATDSPNSKSFEIYAAREGDITYLNFGGNKIDIRSLDPNAPADVVNSTDADGNPISTTVDIYNEANVQLLKEFLATKNHNIDKSLLNKPNKPYTSVVVTPEGTQPGVTYDSYNDYLFLQREDGTTPPLTTGIVPMSKDVNNTQIKRTYLKYDYGQSMPQQSPVAPVAKTDAPTDLTEGAQEDTGLDTPDMVVGQDYNLTVTKADGSLIGTYEISKGNDNKIIVKSDDVNPAVVKIIDFYNAQKELSFMGAISKAKEVSPNLTAGFEVSEKNVIVPPKVDAAKQTNPTSVDQAILEAYTAQDSESKQAPSTVDILAKFGGQMEDPTMGPEVQDLLASEVTEQYKAANIPAEIAWFEGKFPNIPIKVVDGLIDGKSYGRTLNAARVLLSDLAQEGTVYHEAYHIVAGRFTTPETKQEIEDAFTRLTGQTENIEEGLAEEFRSYMLVGDKYKIGNKTNKDSNFIKRFFNAIKEFFNTMLGRGPAVDRQRLQQFFDSIRDNRFVQPVNNPDFAMSMDKRITLADGSKISVDQSKAITESLTRIMFGHLFNGQVPGFSMADLLDLSSKNNSDAKKQKMQELMNVTYRTYFTNLNKIRQNASPEVQQDIDNLAAMVYHNTTAVTQSVFDFLEQFKVQLEIKENAESTKLRDSYNINENNEINLKDTAPAAVKLLIATLPASRSMKNTNSAYGLGLVDYKPFFNLVLKRLAGTESFADQINKLRELAIEHPEYADIAGTPGPITTLINRLQVTKDPSALTANEFKLQRQFRQQFHKFNSEDIIAIYDAENGHVTFMPANADRESALIMSEFRANFKERVQEGKGPFSVDPETGRVVIEANKAFNVNGRQMTLAKLAGKGANINEADALAILNYMGVEFTNPESLSTKQRMDILSELVPSEGTGILSKLVELGEEGVSIEDIFSRESGAFSRFKKIIDIQADRTEKSVDLQFQTADGKTAYGVITNNFTTNIVGRLNNGRVPEFFIDPETGELMESVRGSIFLEGSMGGMRIGMGTLNGIKKEGNRRGFVYENNSPSRRFRTDFNAVLDGRIPQIRPAEKKSQFVFDLNARNEEGSALIDLMPKTEAEYVSQMSKYLRQEIYKALSDHGNSIDGYKTNKGQLRIFDYVTSVNLLDIGGVGNIDAYMAENKEAIEADLRTHLETRAKELFRAGIENKLIKVDPENNIKYNVEVSDQILAKNNLDFEKSGVHNSMLEGDVMNMLKKFVMLHETGNIEQTITILGDIGFFKPDSFFKRTSGPHGPKLFADNSVEVNDWLNQNYERLDGKTADGKMRHITYRDVKASITNERFLEYAQAYGADPAAIQIKLETPNVQLDPKTEEVYEILRPYLEFDEADAQGYMTIDEYMEFLERVGNVTPDQRAAYKKVREGQPLSAQEMAVFPPLKPQYYGPTYSTGIYSPAFIKLSVLPIYPQLVETIGKGSNLGKMLDDMIDNQVGLAVFESGVKVGKVVGTDNASNDFYDESGDYAGIEQASISELYYDFMGIQVETQNPVKTKVSKGSQQRALLASNSYENGKVVNKEVAAIDKRLQVLENELIEAEFESLKREFGIEDAGDEFIISEEGYEKLVEVLRAEAERRDMSDAYLDGLEEFLSGETRVLDVLGNKPKIENLLYSLVSNRIVNYKTFGGAKVQVSSAGIEVEQRTVYQDKHKYGANVAALQFYRKEDGEVKAMQVMLPHYFKELIGEDVTIREDGVYRDGEKIGSKEMLEVYGFRIPTSALNSIEAIEIAGFLPQEAGDAIMVPSEIVVKAGSDFDIDKLSIFLPNYTYNRSKNELNVIPFLTNANSTSTERAQALRTLDPRKYATLAQQVGLGDAVVDKVVAMNKEFAKLKQLDYQNYQNPEVQEVSKQIDDLYKKRKKATRSQRNSIDFEIGLLEMRRLSKIEDADTGMDVSIQSLKDKISKEFEKIDSQIANAVDKQDIPLERQNATQAIQNQILTNSRKIVLNETNYEQLVRPVGAQRLKDMANVIRGLQGKSNQAPRFSDLLKFEFIQEMGNRFLAGKKALGIAAVANTHQIKAQRAGLALRVDPDFSIGMPAYEMIELEDGSLAIPMGGTRDALGGNYVSEIIGEFINAFVDVSKDPFVFDINGNLTTASTYISMLRAGVPLEFVSKFMTQPALFEMVARKTENPAVSLRKINQEIAEEHKTKAEEIAALSGLPTDFEAGVEYTIPSMERMLALGEKARQFEEMSSSMAPEQKAKLLDQFTPQDLIDYHTFQKQVAEKYFDIYQGLTIPMQELSEAVTGDRSGLAPKNRMEAKMQVMKLNTLKAENKFVNLDKYLDESFQKSFEQSLEDSSKMFDSLFATTRKADAEFILDSLIVDIINRRDIGNDDKARFAGMVENALVNYILQTVRTENQQELFKDASRLFQGTKDSPSLARRVMQLKKTTKKSLILNELFPILQTYDPTHPEYATENIKKFNKRLTSFERNALIEDMQVLMEKDPELAKDIVKFIILQSGQQTSPVSFMDLIPAQQYIEIVEPILKKYLAGTKEQSNVNLDNFRLQFYRNNFNNPFVVPEYTKQYVDEHTFEYEATTGKVDLPRGTSNSVRVVGRLAKQKTSPNVPPQEFISVIIPDPSLSKEQRARLKKAGKKTTVKKLFKLTEDSKANYKTLTKALAEGKKPPGKAWTMVWEQIPTLGNGMLLQEYGPRNIISMVNTNNIMLDGKDYTDKTLDPNVKEMRRGKQTVTGDIFNMDGIPIVPVDQSGTFANGLARVAKAKGLPIAKRFTAKSNVISAPIKAQYGEPVDFAIFADTIGKIDTLAKKNPGKTFLLPPLGLEPGNKSTQQEIDSRVVIIKSLLDANPNIKLVIPDSTNPALTAHLDTLRTIFEC
tara:strand:- start:7979 stop:21253 length:13275 start_codon:yes stop_codon:yes gene_type:complete